MRGKFTKIRALLESRPWVQCSTPGTKKSMPISFPHDGDHILSCSVVFTHLLFVLLAGSRILGKDVRFSLVSMCIGVTHFQLPRRLDIIAKYSHIGCSLCKVTPGIELTFNSIPLSLIFAKQLLLVIEPSPGNFCKRIKL